MLSPDQLLAVRNSLLTTAGLSATHNDTPEGMWQDIAAACEEIAATSNPAFANIQSAMTRSALAINALTSAITTTYNQNYEGLLQAFVEALEEGTPGAGALSNRLVLAAAGFTGGGGSYPAIVVARGLQAVWDRRDDTGYTGTLTKFATANSGTRDALPTGASYGLSGSQHYVLVVANGGTPVNFNNWKFTIPLVVFNAGGQCNLTDCWLTGDDLVQQGMKNWYCGLNPFSTTYSDGASLAFLRCTIDNLNADSFTNALSGGLVQNSAAGATMCTATAEYTRFDYCQGSHVQIYGNFTGTRCFFGAHQWSRTGGYVDPNPLDDPPHTEATWSAYGTTILRECLLDPSEANPDRIADTWTAHLYMAARFGELNAIVEDNIMIGHPPGAAPYAHQISNAPANVGTFGSIKVSNNIIDECDSGWFTTDAAAEAAFDEFYDNFDFTTGNRIATPLEVIPGAPVISTAATFNVNENAQLAIALTANEKIVSWAIRTAAQDATSVDHDKFEISGTTLRWAGNGTKDFEAPDDTGTNNTYVVVVRATDNTGDTTDKTITVTVTDVAEFERVQFENSDIFRSASSNHGMSSGTSRMGLLAFTVQMPASIPGTSITLFGNVAGATMNVQILTSSGKVRINLTDNAGGTWRVETTGDECNGQWKTFVVTADISAATAVLGCEMWRYDGSTWTDVMFTTPTWPATAGRTLNWGTAQQWQIGATNFARQFEKLLLRPASTFDATVLANRDKLIDPTVLLANGSGADGTQPNIYLHGTAATWNAGHNNGSGAVFSAVGGITVTDV